MSENTRTKAGLPRPRPVVISPGKIEITEFNPLKITNHRGLKLQLNSLTMAPSATINSTFPRIHNNNHRALT